MVKPLPAILEQIHSLLQVYQTDNIKQLGTLCEKIYEHSLFDEIYKVLIDCEFLIEKTFEVNSVLPMVNHVHIDSLIENCLTVRRL